MPCGHGEVKDVLQVVIDIMLLLECGFYASVAKATMLKKTKGKMKRRNTESSMQLALQAAPSTEPEPEVF